MKLLKKLFGKKKDKSNDTNEPWFNDPNKNEKSPRTIVDGEYYEPSHFDMAVTNQIAKS